MQNPLAADPLPRSFDLAGEAAYTRLRTVQFRVAVGGIGVVIVGAAVLLGLRNAPDAVPPNALELVPVVVFGGMFLLLAAFTRPPIPPAAMTIGPSGLAIRYSDGSQGAWAWTDPSLAFRVIDRSAESFVSPEERVHLDIEFADGHSGTIPKAVLLALDDAALEFHVPRLARREAERVGRRKHVRHVIRFGEPTRTPRWLDAQEVPRG